MWLKIVTVVRRDSQCDVDWCLADAEDEAEWTGLESITCTL